MVAHPCTVLFGTLLTNKSLGYTWAVNSRENKLTPWSNDTMADHIGEYLLLKVDETIYNLCYGAQVEFSPSRAVYRGKAGCVSYTLQVTVDPSESRKNIRLSLDFSGQKTVSAVCAYYTEPIFHADENTGVFLPASQMGTGVSSKIHLRPFRIPLLKCLRRIQNASSVLTALTFSPAAGQSQNKRCPTGKPVPQQFARLNFHQARQKRFHLVLEYKVSGKPLKASTVKPAHEFQISTPDQTLNALFNTWVPYQAEICRMTARTGFYQCGGAYGFRDQLQDASAVLLWNPEKTKKHLLRACSRQFEEGDVLHWWHELPETAGGIKGVRTTCSDDLVWLPYAACEYLEKQVITPF